MSASRKEMPQQLRRRSRVAVFAMAIILIAAIANMQAPAQAMPAAQGGGTPEELQGISFMMGDAELDVYSTPKEDTKLDSILEALTDQSASLSQTVEDLGLIFDGDRVQVVIDVSPADTAAVSAAISASGGTATKISLDGTQIQGFVPTGALHDLAAVAEVQMIRRPMYMQPFGNLELGKTTTEGVNASNAHVWHAQGLRGAGVKVAIIDGGFEGYASLLGSDLPASVTTKNFADTGTIAGSSPHGTACAEIVYDMAPGATLYLIRISTVLDLQEAVTYAISQGVRVISTSGGWTNQTPGDGTGFLANEVARAKAANIFWATAAGNEREAHWSGGFADTNGNSFLEFTPTSEITCITATGGGNCLTLSSGIQLVASVRWNNWKAPVNQDYDLRWVQLNGNVWQTVNSQIGGRDRQSGGVGAKPVEFALTTTSGIPTYYGIAIQRYSASGVANFDAFTLQGTLKIYTQQRSLADLADAPAAFTVAALNVVSPFAQERYSSEGPTNGPGGAASGGAMKPDIAAFANVNTQMYGTTAGSKFNGTSSATPHVAGAAALVRGLYPTATVATVSSFLINRVVDMGTAGRDNDFGYGRLWLGTPPASAPWSYYAYLPTIRR